MLSTHSVPQRLFVIVVRAVERDGVSGALLCRLAAQVVLVHICSDLKQPAAELCFLTKLHHTGRDANEDNLGEVLALLRGEISFREEVEDTPVIMIEDHAKVAVAVFPGQILVDGLLDPRGIVSHGIADGETAHSLVPQGQQAGGELQVKFGEPLRPSACYAGSVSPYWRVGSRSDRTTAPAVKE
jgi:hypothetical protein